MAERRIRTKEERAAEIDQKIIAIKEDLVVLEQRRDEVIASFTKKGNEKRERIKALEKKKKDILNPRPRVRAKTRKQKMMELFNTVYKTGMSAEAAAEMLGLANPGEEKEETE